MARQDNPFALLGDDDEGSDVSVLLAKVEAMMPARPPSAAEHNMTKKQKAGPDAIPSKLPAASEFVRGERGRGRGGRGRGPGRGGIGNFDGADAIEQPEHIYDRGYNGESGGERSRGRGGRGGMGHGRGKSFAGFGNRNQPGYEDSGDGREGEGEFQEKGYYGERRSSRFESRKLGEENQELDNVEKENREFKGYGADFENRGFRRPGADLERREFRNGEGNEKSYSGDGENRGFRGGEGRGRGGYGGRGYGGRGRRGERDGGRSGARYDLNEGLNTSETTMAAAADQNEPIVNNTNNGDGGFGWDYLNPTEEPKDEQSEKPVPEQIVSEETFRVPEKDNEMTLVEYEKLLQEKRKALESLKLQTARKVDVDKDFEGMQIIEKKKEVDLTKLKLDNDKGKKKEMAEREEKSRKSLSINEFLKPADGERYRGPLPSRGRGGRGRGRGSGGYTGDYPTQVAAAPSLEDPAHFPILGTVANA